MSKKGVLLIPFDPDENQMHYPENSYRGFHKITNEMLIRGVHYSIGEYGSENYKSYLNEDIERNYETRSVPPTWVENCEFEAVLEFQGFCRGRSAAYAEFLDLSEGVKYTMFLKDLDELIKNRDISWGQVHSIFTFCKRGQNYGIKLVKENSK